jgi:hypothetical protein
MKRAFGFLSGLGILSAFGVLCYWNLVLTKLPTKAEVHQPRSLTAAHNSTSLHSTSYNAAAQHRDKWLQVHRHECLQKSPFIFRPLVRKQEFAWTIHSLVQSVRSDGPSGLQMRCDWVIGTRKSHWRQIPANTAYGDPAIAPTTIFVHTENRQAFHDHLLPCFSSFERFVLIIGDHDMTTPRQMDKRYTYTPDVKLFSPDASVASDFRYSTWLAWLDDARVVHIFVEHLDEKGDLKVSPIPAGLNPLELSNGVMHMKVEDMEKRFPVSPMDSRPLQVRFTNRVRDGAGQWELRAKTRAACDTQWKGFCVSSPAPSHDGFLTEIARYPFLICAHGGGLDPNPNVWSALLVGTIPIIEGFAGDSMYRDLPVVILADLPHANLSESRLRIWRDSMSYMFRGQERRRVLHKLTTDFWWNEIMSKISRKTSSLPLLHVRA